MLFLCTIYVCVRFKFLLHFKKRRGVVVLERVQITRGKQRRTTYQGVSSGGSGTTEGGRKLNKALDKSVQYMYIFGCHHGCRQVKAGSRIAGNYGFRSKWPLYEKISSILYPFH